MVSSLNYSLFPSGELFTFANGVLTIVNGKTDSLTLLVSFATKLNDKLSLYQEALTRDAKNQFTPKLAAADTILDSSFMAFRNYVEAASYRNTPGWEAATTALETVIRTYGWRSLALGYKAQIAAMSNMNKEIKENFIPQLTVVNGEDWFSNFDTELTAFITLYNESNENVPDNGLTIKETRPALTKALRNMFSMIDLLADDDTSEEMTSLLSSVNELITRSLSTVKAADTREENRKANDVKTPDEGAE